MRSTGNDLTLDDSWPSPTTAPRSGLRRRRAGARGAARAVVDACADGDAPVYGDQHRLRQSSRRRASRKRDLAALQVNLLRSHAAGVDEPLPRARRARVDGAARQRAGQGLFRHPPRDARGARRAAQPRRASARPQPRLGRRERRPRAARAPRARADRRRRDVGRRATADGGAGAGARRARRRSRSAPKEGLALINGTQVSAAVLALALAGAERLARAADITAALSHRRAAGLAPSVRAAHSRAAPVRRARRRPPTTCRG